MKRKLGRSVLAVAAGCAVAIAAGCAASAAWSAKNNYINGIVQQHEYRQPCIYVWPAVQETIANYSGAIIANTSPPPYYRLETNWVPDGTSSTKHYVAEALPSGQDGCRIAITKSSAWNGRASSERDLWLEYRVLQRVEPGVAAQIESQGERLGQDARARYEAEHRK